MVGRKRTKLLCSIGVTVIFVGLLLYFARVIAIDREMKLVGAWHQAYSVGNYKYARRLANKIAWYDQRDGSYYAAHSAVLDSINVYGDVSNVGLADALRNMSGAWFGIDSNSNESPYYMLEATISAMLGDKHAAVHYATRGCSPVVLEKCISESFTDNRGFDDRLTALRNYEAAMLYLAIGKGDKTNAIFYEAVALRYFDTKRSIRLIDQLKRADRYTAEMQAQYCDPAAPPVPELCSQEARGQETQD